MSTQTTTDVRTTLASDYNAAPAPVRAADFGGREQFLCVRDGLASDRYTMAPARFVQVSAKHGTYADTLEPGRYSVPKIGADPLNLGDAPDMVRLLDGAFDREQIELRPFEMEGVGQVHTITRDSATGEFATAVAIFTDDEGRKIGLDVARLDALTNGASPQSVEIPTYFGSQKVVRWTLRADAGRGGDMKPIIVERKSYGRATKANGGGTEVYVTGTWQALLMPVRLGR